MEPTTMAQYKFTQNSDSYAEGSDERRLAEYITHRLFEQTALVDALLKQDAQPIISYDDIENATATCKDNSSDTDDWCKVCEGVDSTTDQCENEEMVEVFQWVAFNASEYELEKLRAARYPLIVSDYGTWLGLTSYGTAWSMYIIPSLLDALYNEPAEEEEGRIN